MSTITALLVVRISKSRHMGSEGTHDSITIPTGYCLTPLRLVRAGKVPHVKMPGGGSAPRDRNKDGTWRKKRSDAGKPKPKTKK